MLGLISSTWYHLLIFITSISFVHQHFIMGNIVSGSGSSSPPSSDGIILSTSSLLPAERPACTDINSRHYPSWKTATLELPLDGTTEWFFFARGSSSAGHVRFVESTSGKVEVVVHVGYADESALESLNVCSLAKGDQGRGVGVYTPHRIHVPRNPLYIHTVIYLPAGPSMPDRMPSHAMTTFTSNTSYDLSLPSVCPLSSLNVQTSNGAVLLSSPVDMQGSVALRTSNASIRGSDVRCKKLKVVTSNASVEFGQVSTPSNLLPVEEAGRHKMVFVTSNGPVRLSSVDISVRSVDCKVETSNKPVSVGFKRSGSSPDETQQQQQQQPKIKVRTSNAPVDFVYELPYTGHLDLRSSGPQGVALAGLDLAQGGENKLKKEADGRIWGQVRLLASEKETNGSIDVASSNARVGITFGP